MRTPADGLSFLIYRCDRRSSPRSPCQRQNSACAMVASYLSDHTIWYILRCAQSTHTFLAATHYLHGEIVATVFVVTALHSYATSKNLPRSVVRALQMACFNPLFMLCSHNGTTAAVQALLADLHQPSSSAFLGVYICLTACDWMFCAAGACACVPSCILRSGSGSHGSRCLLSDSTKT